MKNLALPCLALLIGCGSGAPHHPEACGERPAAMYAPAWAQDAVFYEIFVRSFADSNGDGIGDLRGLIQKLDYLNDGREGGTDLGVRGLWLMPIFKAASYHGYDTVDYESIDPAYGTLADFQELTVEAKKRGIQILLDLVLNHTSNEHPWFGNFKDYYVWANSDLGWRQPWLNGGPAWHSGASGFYYGVFWSGMPDLNYNNSAVRQEMARVGRLWLDRGAAGYRLDAVRYLIETGPGQQQDTAPTHAYWKEFHANMKNHNPNAFLIGEAWAESDVIRSYYGNGQDEMDANFNFPLKDAIRGAIQGNTGGLETVLCGVAQKYPQGILDGLFTGNHDMARLAQGITEQKRLAAAAALLLTLPGSPFIYYGEEIGMQNGRLEGGDINFRTPMLWDDSAHAGFSVTEPWLPVNIEKSQINVSAQRNNPDSLLAVYRKLIALRNKEKSLRQGQFLPIQAHDGNERHMVAYARTIDNEAVVVLFNFGAADASETSMDLSALGSGQVVDAWTLEALTPLQEQNAAAYSAGAVPAMSWKILKLSSN